MTEAQEASPFASLPPGVVDYGKFSFTVKRYVLADLCERAAAAISSRADASHPVLGCFKVHAGGERGLRVAATDMERTIITATSAFTATSEDGLVYLPAKRLVAMLHAAPEGEVTVKVIKNKAEVTVPDAASWDLRLPDSASYPLLPDPGEIEFHPYSREKLLTALKSVRHAICRDAARSNLTQVSISGSGEARVVVASDANRMAQARVPGFPLAMCVPSAAAEDLVKLLSSSPDVKDIEVGQTAGLVFFRVGHVTLAANKRQATFPDVESQLLKPAADNADVLTIDRSQLQSAIKRVRINADTETAAIALDISPGEVAVVSRDKNSNSARETVPAKWDGGKRLVVVNHVFLTEAIDAHPDQACEFKLGADIGKKRSMVLLEGDNLVQVLNQMPPALVGY